MSSAQLERSAELESELARWGLKDAFSEASVVTRAGFYTNENSIYTSLARGHFLVAMKNGSLIMGEEAAAVAEEAYRCGFSVTLN